MPKNNDSPKENSKEMQSTAINDSRDFQFHYRIQGRVQGVGFRNWLEKLARNLALEGYCRNRLDGTVELVAKAPNEKTLTTLENNLQKGPLAARVDRVEKSLWKEEVPKGFRVLDTR